MNTPDLIERLRRKKVRGTNISNVTYSLANPDGPEAADTIERALVEFYFAAPTKCAKFCDAEDKSGRLLGRIRVLCDERVDANRKRIGATLTTIAGDK